MKHMPVTEDDDIDEETLAELEALIENLDLDQLEQLQAAIGGGAEGPKTEFEMISEELRAMGLDQDDIKDLKMMAGLMHEFLILVPDIETKLEEEEEKKEVAAPEPTPEVRSFRRRRQAGDGGR